MTVDAAALARELQELIAALDRRVPRVERAGEASIAREGAALRAKAMKRLAELSTEKAARFPDKSAASSERVDRRVYKTTAATGGTSNARK